MGNNASMRDARKQHQQIEAYLCEESRSLRKFIKLLLLGPAETGKSTILKQMRILHNDGFSELEMIEKTRVIYQTTIKAVISMAVAMTEEFKLPFDDPQRQADLRILHLFMRSAGIIWTLEGEPAAAMLRICRDSSVQAFVQSNRNPLPDEANYFIHQIERICANNYSPSQMDLLKLRIPTCGIVELSFELQSLIFRVIDVGGQRSERKKWIHCFDGVNAVLFIESISLFELVVNIRWFRKSSMILFLNKKDVFQRKLSDNISIAKCFPNFTGSTNYDECVDFIKEKFVCRNQNASRQIFVHETCATDTNQIQLVLQDCIKMIMKSNIMQSGMV